MTDLELMTRLAKLIESPDGREQATRFLENPDALDKDGLTGLYNRSFALNHITHALAFARRHDMNLSVVLIDIDNLKIINDTFGHDAGDKVLQRIGTCLLTAIRDEDIAVRWGGDEFVLIFLDTEYDEAEAIVARVSHLINSDFDQKITMSSGVATLDDFDLDVDLNDLIEVADGRMYKNKQQRG